MEPWKTLNRSTLLAHNKYLTVESHTIELPDGQVLENWPWLTTPDYINVLPITEIGEFMCFRQTKYAVEGTSLAPVGGYLEPGEEPLAAARRELLEETGYRANRWQSLGRYVVDGNRGAGVAHLFLAEEAYPFAPRNADDLEEQELLLLNRSQIEQALIEGQFKVLAWATVVALALLRLSQ